MPIIVGIPILIILNIIYVSIKYDWKQKTFFEVDGLIDDRNKSIDFYIRFLLIIQEIETWKYFFFHFFMLQIDRDYMSLINDMYDVIEKQNDT